MKKICYISGFGRDSRCKELSLPDNKDIQCAITQTAKNIKANYDDFAKESDGVYRLYSVAPIMLANISLSEKIIKACDPIIDLISGVGYPVTNFMLILSCLMIVTGRKKQGIEMMKWACVGYVGIQFIPFMLKILNTLGAELRSLA